MDVVKHTENGVLCIELSGSFTFEDHKVFKTVLDLLRSDKPYSRVVLVVEDLVFADSAALGMLLLTYDVMQERQLTMTIKGAKGQVKRLFDLAHFQRLFTFE